MSYRVTRRMILGVLSVALSAACSATAAPITSVYNFTGEPGNQASTSIVAQPTPYAVFGVFTRGSGITANAGATSINSANWTFNAALDPNDYYTFTLTPTNGWVIQLSSFVFGHRRSATGPQNFELRSSLDGFGSVINSFSVGSADTSDKVQNINLTGVSALQDIRNSVEFRIFGFTATNTGGTWRIGTTGTPTFTIQGEAVPEPSTLVVSGVVLVVALAGWRRRNRRARAGVANATALDAA